MTTPMKSDTLGSIDTYQSLDDLLKQVYELQDKAKKGGWIDVALDITGYSDYGDVSISADVVGKRPMTEQEIAITQQNAKMRDEEQARREYEEFERLQKKFGGK